MTTPNYPYGDPGDNNNHNQGSAGGTPDYGSYGSGNPDWGAKQSGSVGPGGYGQPYQDSPTTSYGGGFENSPMNAKPNKLAAWALGLGIASIVALLTVFAGPLAVLILAAPFLAVAGVIVSIMALVRGKRFQGASKRTGWSVGGLILSVITLLIVVFFTVIVVAFLNSGIMDCFVDNTDAASQQACVEQFLNENA